MQLLQSFMNEIQAGPTWVYWWVNFMGLAFLPALFFAFSRREARLALLVMALNLPFMLWLYAQFGYVRLLGLPHVILWTPLAIELWRSRSTWRVKETFAGKWIALLFMTILISLVFDYADVIRYIAGDRG